MVIMNKLGQKLGVSQYRIRDRAIISVARRRAWQIGKVESHSLAGDSING